MVILEILKGNWVVNKDIREWFIAKGRSISILVIIKRDLLLLWSLLLSPPDSLNPVHVNISNSTIIWESVKCLPSKTVQVMPRLKSPCVLSIVNCLYQQHPFTVHTKDTEGLVVRYRLHVQNLRSLVWINGADLRKYTCGSQFFGVCAGVFVCILVWHRMCETWTFNSDLVWILMWLSNCIHLTLFLTLCLKKEK